MASLRRSFLAAKDIFQLAVYQLKSLVVHLAPTQYQTYLSFNSD